jgi:superfamily II DNA or RNA helicase
VRALWEKANALFANGVACDRAYMRRRYQVKAAIRAVAIALGGRNAGIELPTGTGKTLIACLVAAFWKQLRPDSQVLLIVPSRTFGGPALQCCIVDRAGRHGRSIDR